MYRFCGMCGTELERRRMAAQPIDQPPVKPAAEKPSEKTPATSSILGIAKHEPPEPPKRETVPMPPPRSPEPPPKREPVIVRHDVLVQPRAEDRPRVPARDTTTQPPSRSSLAEDTRPAFIYEKPKREDSPRPFIYDNERSSSVSGPSFLGLGANYVEEEPRRGWRVLAFFVVLLAIAGLIGVQWRRNGYAMPEAAGPTWEKVKAYVRGDQQQQQPPQNTAAPAPVAPPEATTTQVPGKAGDLNGDNKAPQNASPPSAPDTNATTPQAPTPNATSPQNDTNDNTDKNDGTTPQPPERSATKPSPALPRPGTAPKLAEHVAQAEWEQPVNEADGFINARPQQCDRALGILKDAAEHGNPRAGVKLGAMYATGVCVPQDNVTAYAWLSRAMKLDPNNRRLSAARSVVWNQMTSEEQQRAGQQ